LTRNQPSVLSRGSTRASLLRTLKLLFLEIILESHLDLHTGEVPVQAPPLRLYITETVAKKAGLKLADFSGDRLGTVLYALLPEGEKKPMYLLSSSYRLTVAEQRWVTEHQATVSKLGRFHVGGSFIPLQTNMLRKKKSTE
jgi:hypothetical protein